MKSRTVYRAATIVCIAIAATACGRNDAASFVASAESYLAKSNYNAAIIELKNALKEDPNNAKVRFLLAKALLDSGAAAPAETEARKALELKYPEQEVLPVLARALLLQGESKKLVTEFAERKIDAADTRAEVLTSLAVAYSNLEQPKEMRTAINAAIAANPQNVNARIAQARIAALDNDLPGALKLVDAVLATEPNAIDAQLLKADIQTALGNRGEAIATLEHIIEIQPNIVPARFTLIADLTREGQLDRAAAQLEALKKLAPTDPRTEFSQALVSFTRGDMAVAKAAAERALQASPDYVPARYLYGLASLKLGEYATAEEALGTVVAKVPNDEGARRALAEAYLRRGQPSHALQTLDPLLRRRPDDASLLRSAAEIQLALNNPTASADYFERANVLEKGNVAGQVRLAQAQLAMGDVAHAFTDLERLASSEPTKQEPALALISARLRGHDYDKALAAAIDLTQRQPKSPAAYNLVGIVYRAKMDAANARANFEKSLTLDPEYTPAAFNLAALDFAERKYEDARKRYQQLLVKDPKNESVLLGLGDVLIATGAPTADVKSALDRAIQANPSSVRLRVALIRYNATALKDWRGALLAAQAAQAALPDSPEIMEALAATQQGAGDTNQAIDALRRAAEMEPENPRPLVRLADLQVKTRDYDAALTTLRTAATIQPDNPATWAALASVYTEAGRNDAGMEDARRMQKEHPERAIGYGLEGDLLARRSQWSEAASAYKAAFARLPNPQVVTRLYAALNAANKRDEAAGVAQKWLKGRPDDMLLRTLVAQQSLNRKEYKAAAQQYREALAIEPDNALLLNNLAWTLGELGDKQALEYAERSYRLAPNAAAMTDTYGWVQVRLGDPKRGLELLRKATELAPNNAEMRLHLAQGLLKTGDQAGARKELEDLANKPDTPVAQRSEAEKLLKTL